MFGWVCFVHCNDLLLLKVQERAASLEFCPWCKSKGLTSTLRSYRVNLQEAITLCTNPQVCDSYVLDILFFFPDAMLTIYLYVSTSTQCLFPLVSQSLEDVLASLRPVTKRKNPSSPEKDSPKRSRSDDRFAVQSSSDSPQQADHCAVTNGQHAAPTTDGEEVNGYHGDFSCPAAQATKWNLLQDENHPQTGSPASTQDAGHLQTSPEALLTTRIDGPVLSSNNVALHVSEIEGESRQIKNPVLLNLGNGLSSSQPGNRHEDADAEIKTLLPHLRETSAPTEQKPLISDIPACKGTASIKSGNDDVPDLAEVEKLVPVPNRLFWKNSDNLCWLDSLLVAFVNCKSLRKCKPKEEPQQASVWQLIRGYDDVCAAIQAQQRTGRGALKHLSSVCVISASAVNRLMIWTVSQYS